MAFNFKMEKITWVDASENNLFKVFDTFFLHASYHDGYVLRLYFMSKIGKSFEGNAV